MNSNDLRNAAANRCEVEHHTAACNAAKRDATDGHAGGRNAKDFSAEKPRNALGKSEQRVRKARLNKGVRLAIQVAFFILAPAAFSAAFNGVKYVFSQMGTSAPFEATAFSITLLAVLAFTVLFGRFFCGYACAFGTLGDVLYAAGKFVREKAGFPEMVMPPRVVKVASWGKYIVLVGICLACFFGVWAEVSGASPWVSFAGVIAGSVEGVSPWAFVTLAAVMVGMVVRERFFCQFLCPLGAVFSLLPVLGVSRFSRNKACCPGRCGKCNGACPVDIWPDSDAISQGECICCGRCADACPLSNVTMVSAGQAGRKSVRGTEVGLVLAKAALLLAFLWAVGATRYLPPVQNVLAALGLWG